ncbi:MAG: hypothetical protein JKY37_00715 [Nannocystaceae bacterium]|nr:hypothetical protein [Nannocystaceae bacterium]
MLIAFSCGLSVLIGALLRSLLARTYSASVRLASVRDASARRVSQRTRELQAIYDQIVERREEERAHLGRELHDASGQTLTALRIELDLMRHATRDSDATDPAVDRFSELNPLVHRLFDAMDGVVTSLRPQVIDHLGLPAALEWLARDSLRRGRAVDLDVEESLSDLPRSTAMGLFRIAQDVTELLFYTVQPSAITLSLAHKSNEIVLVARPDRGGASPTLRPPDELVRRGLQERARSLGGQVWAKELAEGIRVVVPHTRVPEVEVS